ncbi:hypothetical protein BD311DRAFT_337923 [Dichomitus squalens]|uniref:Uncharacterized protein n=1 Tax=Dichomitus squalens TaxID=114155 RepID=A0A4Q9N4J6_9APHY|nr:hypothetical protein BD311DRAFT_337923 [Dichomitus squalens]
MRLRIVPAAHRHAEACDKDVPVVRLSSNLIISMLELAVLWAQRPCASEYEKQLASNGMCIRLLPGTSGVHAAPLSQCTFHVLFYRHRGDLMCVMLRDYSLNHLSAFVLLTAGYVRPEIPRLSFGLRRRRQLCCCLRALTVRRWDTTASILS